MWTLNIPWSQTVAKNVQNHVYYKAENMNMCMIKYTRLYVYRHKVGSSVEHLICLYFVLYFYGTDVLSFGFFTVQDSQYY
jgi:hypothetical protein